MTDTSTSSFPPPPLPNSAFDPPSLWDRIGTPPASERGPIDARAVIAAATIAVAVDLAVHRRPSSVAGALLIVACSGGLLISGRLDTPQSRRFALAAPVFGCWLAIRSSPWLLPLDVIAAIGLLGAAVATSSSRTAGSLRVSDLARQPFLFLHAMAESVGFALRGVAERVPVRLGQLRSAALGVVLMVPVVLALGALLASGDALTDELLGSIGVGTGARHALVLAAGGWAGLALVYRAVAEDAPEPAPATGFLGPTEATIVLGGIVALYSAFAIVQLAGALGAASEILDSPAGTADWARQGFFQLLWAAGLTLALLITLDRVVVRTSAGQTRPYRSLVAAVAGLTLVVVGVSIARIVRYSDAFGLTMLRLYSALFACWIGAVFVLVALRARSHLRPRWLALRASIAGLGLLLALNVANPEAIVVRFDTTTTARFDPGYLTTDLSLDAVPQLVASLTDLSPDQRAVVERDLCRIPIPENDGWLSWNRSRSQARSALLTVCGS